MKVISWNVKGLRSPNKRMKILRHLKRIKADIALLQETHLSASDFPRMKKLWVGTVLGSEAVGRKAGVLLLIHKNLPCSVLAVNSDSHGRLISAHLKIGSKELVVSNVYAPNSPGGSFYCELSSWLLQNTNLPHLVGGDFNDTLRGRGLDGHVGGRLARSSR